MTESRVVNGESNVREMTRYLLSMGHRAHRRCPDVPRDLSVVAFDETSIAPTVWPELTAKRQLILSLAHALGLFDWTSEAAAMAQLPVAWITWSHMSPSCANPPPPSGRQSA